MNALTSARAALLGIASIAAGILKVLSPDGALVSRLPWTEGFSPAAVRGVGAVELLGGLGLLLPRTAHATQALRTAAAVGLAAFHAGAAGVHLRRGELAVLPVNLALICVAVAEVGALLRPHGADQARGQGDAWIHAVMAVRTRSS